MAIRTFQITSYKIRLGYRMSATFGVTTLKALGIISCPGPDDQRVIVYFLHKESQVPNPAVTNNGKWGNIFLPKELLPVWMEMLRNEKPLYGDINTEIPKLTNISTSHEPVGEEEF
ncbi:MAG: hypothetical protein IQL11_10135 [Bacteroidales bacterium]|nr:hypothetical protein [Bacteroidales bacterium]